MARERSYVQGDRALEKPFLVPLGLAPQSRLEVKKTTSSKGDIAGLERSFA